MTDQERIAQLVEALENYGMHERDCPVGQCHEGRPTKDGGYEKLYGYGSKAKWYPLGQAPPCTCGLDAVLRGDA